MPLSCLAYPYIEITEQEKNQNDFVNLTSWELRILYMLSREDPHVTELGSLFLGFPWKGALQYLSRYWHDIILMHWISP